MKWQLKLAETDSQIKNSIGQALLPQVSKYMDRAVNIVKAELPPIIARGIQSSPEYSAIIGGRLRAEFGIPDPGPRLAGLIGVWTNNLNIKYVPPKVVRGGTINSRFGISMFRVDFGDVLFTPYASVYDNLRGYNLNWLNWLVIQGNAIIVPEHKVEFGSFTSSRTREAIMKPGGSWQVPAQYQGTESDNWITRTLETIKPQIASTLKKAFK